VSIYATYQCSLPLHGGFVNLVNLGYWEGGLSPPFSGQSLLIPFHPSICLFIYFAKSSPLTLQSQVSSDGYILNVQCHKGLTDHF